MKRKNLLLILLLTSCSGASATDKQTSILEITDPTKQVVVVDGHLNNTPVRIWLDTGATHAGVTPRLVRQLNLEFESISNVQGVSGESVALRTYNLPKIKIGHVVLSNLSAFAVELFEGDVIIGMPLLREARVTFDLPRGIVEVIK